MAIKYRILFYLACIAFIVMATLFGVKVKQLNNKDREITALQTAATQTTISVDTNLYPGDTNYTLTPQDSLLIFKIIAKKQLVFTINVKDSTVYDTSYIVITDTLPVLRRFYPGIHLTRHFKLPYKIAVDDGRLFDIWFGPYELYETTLHTRTIDQVPVPIKTYRSFISVYGMMGNDMAGWLSWNTFGGGFTWNHKRGGMLGLGYQRFGGDDYINLHIGYRITK